MAITMAGDIAMVTAQNSGGSTPRNPAKRCSRLAKPKKRSPLPSVRIIDAELERRYGAAPFREKWRRLVRSGRRDGAETRRVEKATLARRSKLPSVRQIDAALRRNYGALPFMELKSRPSRSPSLAWSSS
jgi:hypothetical protein